MLVIEVGVKFRAVSVKRANIFDQDCSLALSFKKRASVNLKS
jgi:hypothetical protein